MMTLFLNNLEVSRYYKKNGSLLLTLVFGNHHMIKKKNCFLNSWLEFVHVFKNYHQTDYESWAVSLVFYYEYCGVSSLVFYYITGQEDYNRLRWVIEEQMFLFLPSLLSAGLALRTLLKRFQLSFHFSFTAM